MSSGHEEWLIEYTQAGNSLKVSAIDPVTGREASIIGPVSAGKHDLAQLAIRKLKKQLAAKKDG